MLGSTFCVFDGVAELRAQLRVFNRHGLVNRGVAGNIRCIVGQGTYGKRILIRVLTFQQHLVNKVPATNIMGEIAKFLAAKWIVAEILDHSAAVSIGVRLLDRKSTRLNSS